MILGSPLEIHLRNLPGANNAQPSLIYISNDLQDVFDLTMFAD